MAVLGLSTLGCDSPAQIVEIVPQRGALEVRTNLPIQVRFDRPVDGKSVVDRFAVRPDPGGSVSWKNSNTLVYEHPPLRIDTDYTVGLEAGFKDGRGVSSQFRHSWHFHTERAPTIAVSSPAQREKGVDPAAYLTLGFNHAMNAVSFSDALALTPSVPYQVRSDPVDPRRVVIAPRSLLEPNTEYILEIGTQALDADGNHVPATRLLFTTGVARSLQHWITFIAGEAATGSGLWMVDETGFPRVLSDLPVESFTWAPDGATVLIRRPDGSWSQLTPGQPAIELPFEARWAAFLGADLGYVYLKDDRLERLRPGGFLDRIATGVGEVAVAPDLARIAFTLTGSAGGEIDGYDLGLHARYVILREGQDISRLAWSSNGLRLAYLLAGATTVQNQLRVKSLTGTGAVTTVATGEIAEPAWLAGSNSITFSARLDVKGQPAWRIFRINTSVPPPSLTPQVALVANIAGDATSPRPSPDGHQIAFLSGPPGSEQIWLMNADGTRPQRLTKFDPATFPYSSRALHWSGF